MRFAILLSVCVSLATTSLSNSGEFSQVHDLAALKSGATDLDAILLETHALIDAANGPEDSGREMVKVSIDGQDIEIPHLSLASSVAYCWNTRNRRALGMPICSAIGFLLCSSRRGTGYSPALSFTNAIRLSFWSDTCLRFPSWRS